MDDPIESAWRVLVSLVFEGRDSWRRRVAEEVDMPFSRVRVLRRLREGPQTVGDLATAAAMDAPAATVCVNHLENLGYVVRTVDPENRRRKQVTITDAGIEVLDRAAAVDDPVPDALRELRDEDAAELHRILSSVANIER